MNEAEIREDERQRIGRRLESLGIPSGVTLVENRPLNEAEIAYGKTLEADAKKAHERWAMEKRKQEAMEKVVEAVRVYAKSPMGLAPSIMDALSALDRLEKEGRRMSEYLNFVIHHCRECNCRRFFIVEREDGIVTETCQKCNGDWKISDVPERAP